MRYSPGDLIYLAAKNYFVIETVENHEYRHDHMGFRRDPAAPYAL